MTTNGNETTYRYKVNETIYDDYAQAFVHMMQEQNMTSACVNIEIISDDYNY